MFAIAVSRMGDGCAQVNATDYGWARVFPISSRSEAHKTLSLLFTQDSIQSTCIYDSAKEMIHCKFYQKLKNAACQLKQLEPYTPWSNAAEKEIKELKKGAGCKLLQSKGLHQMGLLTELHE